VENTPIPKAQETPRNKGGRPRKNWDDARHLYVHGMVDVDGHHNWPTLQQVGEKFDIASIERTAGQQKWTEDREMYQLKLAQARQEKRVEVLAARAAEFDAAALRVFSDLIRQVGLHLEAATKIKGALDSATLTKLAATARMAHVSGRLAMGDTTEITKQVSTVTHEFDLSNLSDGELATLEVIRGKMQGVIVEQPSDGTVH
jgi:multidrug efflux pump subunit AcrA (membrane-fusion protein)